MNWALGILNASQASYLPLQNNAILTNRRFEIVGATQKKALAKASAFFNEAHPRCMRNEAGLRPMKRAFGT